MKYGGKTVKIQQIENVSYLGTKKNFNLNNAFFRLSSFENERIKEAAEDSFHVDSFNKVDTNKQIDEYFKTSKKEVKDVEAKAKSHIRQCFRMYYSGMKSNFKTMLKQGKYNVTFGEVNEKTKIPKSINYWKNGDFVRSYQIYSTEPVSCIEVYDKEDKNNIEQYFLIGKSLVLYSAKNPQKQEVKVITPSKLGFYKVEGKYNGDIVQKSKEIECFIDKKSKDTYFEYKNGAQTGYAHNKIDKKWHKIPSDEAKRNRVINLNEI